MTKRTPGQRALRFCHKVFRPFHAKTRLPQLDYQSAEASRFLQRIVADNKPCFIGRFGSNELTVIRQHIEINLCKESSFKKNLKYALGFSGPTWWEPKIRESMELVAGFFPATDDKLSQFAELMLNDVSSLDVLGSWLPNEALLSPLMPKITRVALGDLSPAPFRNPWTASLKHKRVLVVHPFSETIKHQYRESIRDKLYKDPDFFPPFDLTVLRSVQSIARNRVPFPDWFAALNYMKAEIDRIDFEIAIIGAGAYGFPLAAHIKRSGRKAIHLGGATQLLFGIKGARWDHVPSVSMLYNEHWIHPLPSDVPPNYMKAENGCYW